MAETKEKFKYLGVDNPRQINWFPGHMAKAMKEVQNKLKLVDVVLEIRDARLPRISANPQLLGMMGEKRRLIILNKTNLADPENVKEWKRYFKETQEPAIFINALDPKTFKEILPQAKAMMKEKWAKFEKKGFRPPPLRLMVLGVPNTGKSTLINRLSKRRAAGTGDKPGVTRHQEWINLDATTELLDTPGIMTPKIESHYQGLCLCAIYAIRDDIVGAEAVARFVLEAYLHQKPQALTERYQIEACEYEDAITQIAQRLRSLKEGGEPDLMKTSAQILSDYREGRLAPLILEAPGGSWD